MKNSYKLASRLGVLALGALSASAAFAQAPLTGETLLPIKHLTPIMPWRWCLVDAKGNQIGYYHYPKANNNPINKNVGAMKVIWDGTNSDPSTVDQGNTAWAATLNNFYGTGGGFYGGDQFDNWTLHDDVTVQGPGAAGQSTNAVGFEWIWDPKGTNDVTFSENQRLVFWFTDKYGHDAVASPQGYLNGGQTLIGIRLDFASVASNRAGGYGYLSVVPSLDGFMPAAWDGNGGILAGAYSYDSTTGATINLTTEKFQWTRAKMCNPTDPVAPGTNPSSSSSSYWRDRYATATGTAVNQSDYKFDNYGTTSGAFSEYFPVAGNTTSIGYLQLAVGTWYDPTVRHISGTVTTGGVPFNPTRPMLHSVFMVIKDASGVSNAVATSINPANGKYIICDTNQDASDPADTGGVRQLSLHFDSFLRKVITVDTTGGASVTNADFSLTNGDVDANNIVNINDYSVLSDNFNIDSTNAAWAVAVNGVYPFQADLDHNNAININDYAILSDNFNLVGDPTLDSTIDP